MSDLEHLAHAVRTSPPVRRVVVPSYAGITLGASVLQIVGAIYIVTGMFVFILSMVASFWDPHPFPPNFSVKDALPLIFGSILVLGFGLVIFMAGSIAKAIRDMAQNSFR